VETGTANRGIYQNAVLFNPLSDPPPTPFSPPKGWNSRLLAQHGAGCPGGWYIQGSSVSPSAAFTISNGEVWLPAPGRVDQFGQMGITIESDKDAKQPVRRKGDGRFAFSPLRLFVDARDS
jgi:hypothetical protein